MRKLKAIKYLFPEEEIKKWENGEEDLSKELKNNVLSFLKYNPENKRIETSKFGNLDLDFALDLYAKLEPIISKLKKDGDSFESYTKGIKTLGSMNEGKIIIKFTCVYITLDNLIYILKKFN